MQILSRQCGIILLLFAMLMQTFSKAVIVVDFYANQDVIARTLCENRDKPMLHCCGRCQLRKRLAREDNEKNSPERKPENKNPSLFTAAHTLIGISHLLLPPIRYAPSPSDNQTFDQPSFCFHPPD